MILGLSSFTFGWEVGVGKMKPAIPLDEIELVHRAVSLNLKCLQLGDNLPLHTFSKERLNNFRNLLEKYQLRLEIGAKELTAENLRIYTELAIYFKAPLLRFVIDGENHEPKSEDVVSLLRDFKTEFKKNNLFFGIENHDRFHASELANMITANTYTIV